MFNYDYELEPPAGGTALSVARLTSFGDTARKLTYFREPGIGYIQLDGVDLDDADDPLARMYRRQLKFASALKRVAEGDLVGVLEVDTDGDAAGEARDVRVDTGVSDLALNEQRG